MLPLKLVGGAAVIFAAVLFGMYKSSKSKMRRDLLRSVCMGLDSLSAEIRLKRGTLYETVARSFECEYLIFSGGVFKTANEIPGTEFADKLNELVEALGKSDAEGECEKIAFYRDIFARRLAEAETDYKTDSKIWNTLGLSAGITVVLLLI